jgi:hypothetical protein
MNVSLDRRNSFLRKRPHPKQEFVMSGSSFVGILFMALTAGSVNATDWMSMVQPTEYFKSRDIDPTLDRMIDFVIEDVNSPKVQIRQLAALQHLANESDKFKQGKNYNLNRMAIEEIAEGKRGKDPAGFGQEYARRLLAKLDGAKFPATKFRPLRQDALNWFPADTKLALAFDMNQLQELSNDTRKGILTTLSDFSRLNLYDQLEAMGNLRVDRLAFAIVDAEKPDDQKIFMRISGKGNQAWIADALIGRSGDQFQVKKTKDADGTPILTLHSNNAGACVVLIGNTDMIVVSYQNFDGKHEDLVAELLAVRAKKKPHAGDGNLKDRLASIPDKAIGFLVGDLPGDMKNEIGQMLDPVPAKFSAYVERAPMGLDVKAETVMKNAAEADKFVAKAGALRKEGIEGLQQAMKEPPQPGLPPVPFQAITTLAESVQVKNKGERVQISGFIGSNLIQQLGEWYVAYNNPRSIEAPPKNAK